MRAFHPPHAGRKNLQRTNTRHIPAFSTRQIACQSGPALPQCGRTTRHSRLPRRAAPARPSGVRDAPARRAFPTPSDIVHTPRDHVAGIVDDAEQLLVHAFQQTAGGARARDDRIHMDFQRHAHAAATRPCAPPRAVLRAPAPSSLGYGSAPVYLSGNNRIIWKPLCLPPPAAAQCPQAAPRHQIGSQRYFFKPVPLANSRRPRRLFLDVLQVQRSARLYSQYHCALAGNGCGSSSTRRPTRHSRRHTRVPCSFSPICSTVHPGAITVKWNTSFTLALFRLILGFNFIIILRLFAVHAEKLFRFTMPKVFHPLAISFFRNCA